MAFDYDAAYRRPGLYWGSAPNDLCLKVVDLVPAAQRVGCRVIDLGCGEGRDLVHFAREGFRAKGIDRSTAGLAKAAAWAEADGLRVQVEEADLVTYRLSEPYDVVYGSGTLTYLPPRLRAEVFSNYKRWTRPGGLNAFNAFVEKPYLPIPHDWGDDEYFFRSGELLGYYRDWQILHVDEMEFDCNSGGAPHRHAMAVVIARRPG
ncbi:MAG TPA: methyltransferase domain-containing protein [Bacillota bacterium]